MKVRSTQNLSTLIRDPLIKRQESGRLAFTMGLGGRDCVVTSDTFVPTAKVEYRIQNGLKSLVQGVQPNTGSSPSADKERVENKTPVATSPWNKEIIYFPMTDRFYDGDLQNDYGVDPNNPVAFHGGDLQGLIDKLDYIKSLGVTTLWISPLADNTGEAQLGDFHGWGYHGYWIRDHYKVEEHQGDLQTARRLVEEAHKRGLKVVLDVVLNHVGPDHPFVSDPSKYNWFHHFGDITDWNDQHQVEVGRIGYLPDLDQDNPEVYNYLLDNTVWWIDQLGVDGVRLDAVKHINKGFWRRFIPDLKRRVGRDLFVVGEVLHGSVDYVAPYQEAGIDYLFDMPLYFTITDVFAKGASARLLGARFAEDSKYKDPTKLVTFIDNHDFPRFYTQAGEGEEGRLRLKLALAFLMTIRGLPAVYYGTEVAMPGGGDPDNRRMMDFSRDPDLRKYFARLTSIRREYAPLQMGSQLEMWQDDKVYAFARQYEGDEVVAVFNNGDGVEKRHIPLRAESYLKDGIVMRDLLSGRTLTIRNGHLDVELERKSAMILVPDKEN